MDRDLLLVIGGAQMTMPAILAAKHEFGFKTIVIDGDKDCPGSKISDYFIHHSIYDTTGLLNRIYEQSSFFPHRVAGVITCGTDAANAVYACTDFMGLRGIPPLIATIVQNKARMRTRLSRLMSEHTPMWFSYHGITKDPIDTLLFVTSIREDFDRIREETGDTAILKPVGQRASKGITFINSYNDIPKAIYNAVRYGTHALLEQRLRGDEYSVEGLFNEQGNIVFFNIVKRLFDYSDGALEIGHINPAPCDPSLRNEMYNVWKEAAECLGVNFGPFKVDMMVSGNKVYILETACRISGGWDSQITTPLASGISSICTLIALSTGLDYNKYLMPHPAQRQRYAACCSLFPRRGRVIHVDPILGKLANDVMARYSYSPFDIYDIHARVSVGIGDIIKPYEDCSDRAGFAILTDEDPDNAVRRAKDASHLLSQLIITTTTHEG